MKSKEYFREEDFELIKKLSEIKSKKSIMKFPILYNEDKLLGNGSYGVVMRAFD